MSGGRKAKEAAAAGPRFVFFPVIDSSHFAEENPNGEEIAP
jgi:hypothetical protein